MTLLHSKVYGIVQGVGFRPFVSRLASMHSLIGSVCNKGPYVEIYVQGSSEELQAFYYDLEAKAPERSSILKIDTEELPGESADYSRFEIIESSRERGDIFVSPDIATCEHCQKELFDPHDRRYLHPFINCTACGPRLTILEAMPYDRERTSMKEFPMCDSCRKEYKSPKTRRYDAQPVCCNDCGPEVYIIGEESCRGGEAIRRARKCLVEGGIVAIKGIGGFHLACDARNGESVNRLRKLKHRPWKPFAIMMRNLEVVQQECLLEPGQKAILTGHQKPIMLLKRSQKCTIAEAVAPGNPKIGAMLPYSPIHLLLFDYPDGIDMPDALVMTSGNPSGAPICRSDDEARSALASLCDLMLSHNRKIRLRADDSVLDWADGKPYMVRRSRGYAPLPVMLSQNLQGEVLGMGGELKNTFCLGHNNLFYPSPYIGDMTDLRSVQALQESTKLMAGLLENEPALVACDLHPRYNTTTVAQEMKLPLFRVQHHYAHILSCMAENDHAEPVIGVSFDGTGYGTDGTIWGGEILKADYAGFKRLGSIKPFLQAGGDLASREGWRLAIAMIYGLFKDQNRVQQINQKLGLCSKQELTAQFFMVDNQVNCIKSTSVGRLFDAVSAMLNIRRTSTYEGEAAMYLEYAAESYESRLCTLIRNDLSELRLKELASPPDESAASSEIDAPSFCLPTDKLFEHILNERLEGGDIQKLAWEFHAGLAGTVIAACEKAREITGLDTAALSGGVFQNRLLMRLCLQGLKAKDFKILTHSLIPPNDGGLGLGQAVAAMYHLQNKSES